MDNLRREIKKQVEYCLNFNRYKAGFFVSDVSKIDKIKEILDGVNKIVGQMMHVVKLKENELYVEFWNGSSMKVFVPSENCRGYKFNALLIYKSIEQDVKDCIVYPTIIRRYVEVDGVLKFEDRLETNKRIVEVEI